MPATASDVDPWFVNNALQPPELRYALSALLGKHPTNGPLTAETGVLPGANNPFVPTSDGTATSPRVMVNPGHCVVHTTLGGTYICTWPVAKRVDLTTPASNPRIDVLCARVLDSDVDAGSAKQFEIVSVDGTPAANPVAPVVPAGYLPLFDLRVASSSQGGTVTITDRRTYTRAGGGIRFCPEWDLARPGSYAGDIRVRDNGAIDGWVYNTLTSAFNWVPIASPALWTSFTPKLYYSGTNNQGNSAPGECVLGPGSSAIGRYMINGKSMHLRYIFRCRAADSPNLGSGTVYTMLPPGITSAPQEETQIFAKINAFPGTPEDGIFLGKCFIPESSQVMRPYFPLSKSDNRLHDYIVARQSGVVGTGTPNLPGAYPYPTIMVIQGTVEIS